MVFQRSNQTKGPERPYVKNKLAGHWWLTPVILATWEAGIRRTADLPAQANTSEDPISKINRAKWTGDVAQAAEHLLCKCEEPLVKKKRVGGFEGWLN
jgi:hypothetical protein